MFLRNITVCCIVLQCIAVYCSVLQGIAVYWSVLQFVVVYVVQYIIFSPAILKRLPSHESVCMSFITHTNVALENLNHKLTPRGILYCLHVCFMRHTQRQMA